MRSRDAMPDGDPAPDAQQASLRFARPMTGARFTKDQVFGHRWAAGVQVRVEASEQVRRVEIWSGARHSLGSMQGRPLERTVGVRGEGEIRLVARGFDGDGQEVARDAVSITVDPPSDPSCHAMLNQLGLDWEPTSPSEGIDDPIMLEPHIRGVDYRFVTSDEPTRMLMDCELAPRLVQVAELVKEFNIDEIVHVGIYNYRCIGGGDPDSGDCTPSQHAFARAIDFHAFGVEGSETTYNVETDWVITEGETCPGDPADRADEVLHEIACRMWSERIFQVVLTPNYNSAHRNHFHVDMSEGSMFIEQTVRGVDPLVPGLGH
jgi:hypothetical protein